MSAPLIGLIAHVGKPGAVALIRCVLDEFSRFGAVPKMESKTADALGVHSGFSTRALGDTCDLLVALGGDGTLLRILRDLGDSIKPIFGINHGSLGFLTCVSSAAYAEAVQAIMSGHYVLSHRTLLTAHVEREGQIIASQTGLNDVVVSRGEISRLIKLQTRVNGAALTEYNADGLIIATSTGSTAYALSAGGPILTPESGVFLITPICPHVLTNRSVIISDTSIIEIAPSPGQRDVFLSVDGQELLTIHSGDLIRIEKCAQDLPLAMLPQISFFEVLRQKLKWSGSAV